MVAQLGKGHRETQQELRAWDEEPDLSLGHADCEGIKLRGSLVGGTAQAVPVLLHWD